MLFKSFNIIRLIYLMAVLPMVAHGQESPLSQDAQAKELLLLRASVEAVKKNLVDINSELLVLREAAQFPEPSQVVIFLAMERLPRFHLESVDLQLDGRRVANYRYTPHEKEAIQKGALHRLYTGNLDTGAHTLKAVFHGRLSDAQEYSNSVNYNFRKAGQSKIFTLGIHDLLQDNSPDMTIYEGSQDSQLQ